MISNSRIVPFDKYVLRTPLFPFSLYLELVRDYATEKAKQLYQESPIIREAINLASPSLLQELNKWGNNDSNLSAEKAKKLEITFLKYLARMSSRCTPFGLFSGCSVGRIDEETKIILGDIAKFERFTQFDMQFWISLIQEIATNETVIPFLKYNLNNSIYKVGDFYRYIEYKTVGTKREHSITALRESAVLTKLLDKIKSEPGLTLEEMVMFLADDESEKQEAQDFILKLIEFQFLVSELDASVTGSNEWERVLLVLSKIQNLTAKHQILKDVKTMLNNLDQTLVPSEGKYHEIKNDIGKLEITFDEKYLFQTDLNTFAHQNTLDKSVYTRIQRALSFLNCIQTNRASSNQENFKKAFIRRYETKMMPLTTALDTEIGIGYLQNQNINDDNEILDFLAIKPKQEDGEKQLWTSYDLILQRKINESILEGKQVINLTKKDFADFNADYKDVPATFSVMIEVFGKDEIVLYPTGDVSAIKLLGRFCNGNSDIYSLTKDIVAKEQEFYKNEIMAEVVHFPESRTGNILRRPVLRKHEIGYLAKPGVSEDDNIDLNDLWITVENDSIVLFSKKLNKKVIPCLSNAHNYSKNSLPVYHFLCDLQEQHSKPIYSFSWGILEQHYNFFPRVVYQEVILSKAQWIVKNEELSFLSKSKDSKLMEEFLKWKSARNLPRYLNLVSGDNTLLIDFETEIGMEIFLKSVQNKEKVLLEEFLFTKETAVKNQDSEYYCNQFILSFYKE
ncbi:lantibiotic dehydratase family protein [Flavobacterium chungbukense]|uniref:Lantibiotic dehydratase N-terminal domain-containing protein n=1 Tax=Flavobacterium chungbukense TaxID=877464 RepID=A0ABP7YMZ6_9FLAO|nr:lantibiotic dehydratase family protein [Flavobacterium chungbukense]MCC4919894.1 lantibiotic dehydratase family protein [Flavobacterium chungbukense]